MGYGETNGHMTDDITWLERSRPWPNYLYGPISPKRPETEAGNKNKVSSDMESVPDPWFRGDRRGWKNAWKWRLFRWTVWVWPSQPINQAVIQFLQRDAMHSAVLVIVNLCVCLSVHLSICQLVYCAHMVRHAIMISSPHVSHMPLVFRHKISCPHSKRHDLQIQGQIQVE